MQNPVLSKEPVTYWRSLRAAIVVLAGCVLSASAQTPPSKCTASIQWNSAGFPLTQAEANACWPNDTNYNVATEMYNIVKTSGCANALVQNARANSSFPSTLTSSTLNANLALLLKWTVKDLMNSCINTQSTIKLALPSDSPTGTNAAGATNAQLTVLSNTYWLGDNAIYDAAALQQYTTYIGTQLYNDYTANWGTTLPNGVVNYTANICNENMSQYAAGSLPLWDTSSGGSGSLCSWISAPAVWSEFSVQQYPQPGNSCFANLTGPVVGLDSQVLTSSVSGCQAVPSGATQTTSTVAIATNASRDLLKYGCLRQVLKGDTTDATTMFNDAIATWDGTGFIDNPPSPTGKYSTRDFTFALMCANALGINNNNDYVSGSVDLPKSTIENQIWALQEKSGSISNTNVPSNGGIWTDFCTPAYGTGCNTNPLIDGIGSLNQWGLLGSAKETEEDAPLVLLAYGKNIWKK